MPHLWNKAGNFKGMVLGMKRSNPLNRLGFVHFPIIGAFLIHKDPIFAANWFGAETAIFFLVGLFLEEDFIRFRISEDNVEVFIGHVFLLALGVAIASLGWLWFYGLFLRWYNDGAKNQGMPPLQRYLFADPNNFKGKARKAIYRLFLIPGLPVIGLLFYRPKFKAFLEVMFLYSSAIIGAALVVALGIGNHHEKEGFLTRLFAYAIAARIGFAFGLIASTAFLEVLLMMWRNRNKILSKDEEGKESLVG